MENNNGFLKILAAWCEPLKNAHEHALLQLRSFEYMQSTPSRIYLADNIIINKVIIIIIIQADFRVKYLGFFLM